ncbi:hypothetical protein OOK60_14140 [Trichothermofontia sichuanensis B231]|uniref:photosystem II protein, Psb35-related n=1 Tax=Trichothermofontia sichuanensis TaxID=3045816 RepID=UPI00224652DE|nr:hypothetical protein [Trichothermofontia sichuanensis]UZQ53628.1 hypothetical protein OOK60_14140 [Trichothermofontia sichuanensis B231]
MAIVISVLIVGWVAASIIGTQAYFRGEQTKPIHARNWRSASFEKLSEVVTGQSIDHQTRTPAFDVVDAYTSNLLPNA